MKRELADIFAAHRTPKQIREHLTAHLKIVEGSEAYKDEARKAILDEVCGTGAVYEWVTGTQSVFILPPSIALQLLNAPLKSQNYLPLESQDHRHVGKQMNTVREGMIALRESYGPHERMMAILINRDVAFTLLDALEKPERDMKAHFEFARGLAAEMVAQGHKVHLKMSGEGIFVDVDPK